MDSKRRPTVGSLFTGIGGFDLGLERAGWEIKWQIEKDKFRRQILKRHWPDVELREDVESDTVGLEPVDLICGGFPCQDVSLAGRRFGLAGRRSRLWFSFIRVVKEMGPPWVIIENVPGLLSSHEGRDFEIIIQGLAECGYGVAWRVLDSQYFGIPQHRRRIFIVGCSGKPCPPEILFECRGLFEHSPPEQKPEGIAIAGALGEGSYIPKQSHALHGQWDSHRADSQTYCVVSTAAYANGMRKAPGIPGRLDANPDGPRYSALGDAVSVPVAEWIGRRLLAAHFETGKGA